MKRERLPIRRERFRDWKVFKHIEDGCRTMTQEDASPSQVRSCGSSIAHGQCVYAGPITTGVPLCHARIIVWNGCPFQALHASAISQTANELREDAA